MHQRNVAEMLGFEFFKNLFYCYFGFIVVMNCPELCFQMCGFTILINKYILEVNTLNEIKGMNNLVLCLLNGVSHIVDHLVH